MHLFALFPETPVCCDSFSDSSYFLTTVTALERLVQAFYTMCFHFSLSDIFPQGQTEPVCFLECIKGTCCRHKLLTFSVTVQLWMRIISLFVSAFPPHSGRKPRRGACFWEVEVLVLPSDGPRQRWLYRVTQ